MCLALIVDGRVELGIIGCPNLGPEPAKIGEEVIPNGKGVLVVAVRGEGSWSVSSTAQLRVKETKTPDNVFSGLWLTPHIPN